MRYFVFVDNSNVWIEGKYVSAVKRGFAKDIYDAHSRKLQDNGWAVDFGRLLYEVTETNISDIKDAILFGSKPTDKDSLWKTMEQCGFRVVSLPRNIANKEKQIDTGIVAEILETLYTRATEDDIFVLVMGDSDYVPVMQRISNKNVKTVVAFWENVSGELKKAAGQYINLSDVIEKITYQ